MCTCIQCLAAFSTMLPFFRPSQLQNQYMLVILNVEESGGGGGGGGGEGAEWDQGTFTFLKEK